MNPIALVTGATGFLGRPLCARLLADGWTVRAVVRRTGAVPAGNGIEPIVIDDLGRLGDARQRDLLARSLAGTQAVFHLAAVVHQAGRENDDAHYQALNVEAVAGLAGAAAAAGVGRFVLLSSIKAVGERTEGAAFDPDSRPRPLDAYGRSKLAAEQRLRDALAGSDTGWTVVRPPLVYGPDARANLRQLLGLLKRQLPLPLASVHNQRSLVGRDNLVGLLTGLCLAPDSAGRVLMPADGDWSTPELLRVLASGLGVRARLFPCPVPVLAGLATLAGRRDKLRRLTDSLTVRDPYLLQQQWRPRCRPPTACGRWPRTSWPRPGRHDPRYLAGARPAAPGLPGRRGGLRDRPAPGAEICLALALAGPAQSPLDACRPDPAFRRSGPDDRCRHGPGADAGAGQRPHGDGPVW
ncbi:MAG: NAD-dependent epimerase/dehydratase family protein [Burkholderiaceae bacterium]